MKEIYLVRHAQTIMNIQRKYSGITDCDISEQGFKEIEQLKIKMKNYNIEQCYSSPLKRSYITAQSFFSNPIKINNLHEMDFGILEGVSFEEAKEKYPQLFYDLMNKTTNTSFPNGEDQIGFVKRVVDTFNDIIDKDDNDSIAIVSHSLVNRAILSHILTGNSDIFWKISIENCGITKIVKHEKEYTLEFLNR